MLATWGWMFGALCIPFKAQHVVFGPGDTTGKRLRQPHDRLTAAMIVPVHGTYALVRKIIPRVSAGINSPATAKTSRAEDLSASPAVLEK